MNNEPITLTLAAEEYLAEIIEKNPGKAFFVGVNGKGCAGFQYEYDLVDIDTIEPADSVIERVWGKVVIDSASLIYILGSTLNLKEDLWSCELVWNNPLATSTCGCGKSFSPIEGSCSE
jgi:iron-sulfur cluster assembly accessory protein